MAQFRRHFFRSKIILEHQADIWQTFKKRTQIEAFSNKNPTDFRFLSILANKGFILFIITSRSRGNKAQKSINN